MGFTRKRLTHLLLFRHIQPFRAATPHMLEQPSCKTRTALPASERTTLKEEIIPIELNLLVLLRPNQMGKLGGSHPEHAGERASEVRRA
jgi:hypothetical protein